MTRASVLLAGGLGIAAPLWTLSWYAPEDTVARALIGVMLLGLCAGLVELYRRASELDALAGAIALLEGDAASLDERLRGASPALLRLVRSRQQGEARGLPALGLAPFLVSLLVLLGLLGTFVGLISTLAGARDALSASGDVAALRASLLVPMQGLSRAFGTSVAGVSASAMLGLALTLTRRFEERLYATLDDRFAGGLADATLVGRQMRALERLAGQSNDLPEVVARLGAVVEQLPVMEASLRARHDEAMGALERSVREAAAQVSTTLREGIAGAIATQERTLAGLGEETARVLAARAASFAETLAQEAERRAEADASLREEGRARESAFAERLEERWQRFVEEQGEQARAQAQREQERAAALDARMDALFRSDEQRQQERSARDQAMTSAWMQSLEAHQERDAARAQQAGDALARAAELVAVATRTLEGAADHLGALEQSARSERAEAARLLHAEVNRWLEEVAHRLSAERADTGALAERFAAQSAALEEHAGARIRALGDLLAQGAAEQASALASLCAQSQQDLQAQEEASATRMAALGERFARAAEEQQRAIEALAARSEEALQAREVDASARLREVTERVAEMTEARLEAERGIEEGLRRSREETAQAFSSALSAYAEEVREALGQATIALRAGTEGMVAGGIEMGLLAEKFSTAVDAYREASEAWLSRLPALAGQPEGSPPPRDDERLGDMLERTRDMFDRSMELQMELYRGVRALRDGSDGSDPSDGSDGNDGGDEVAEGAGGSAPLSSSSGDAPAMPPADEGAARALEPASEA